MMAKTTIPIRLGRLSIPDSVAVTPFMAWNQMGNWRLLVQDSRVGVGFVGMDVGVGKRT